MADMGTKLWDTLWAAGRQHGLVAAGRSAFGSLRLEKGYRSWGADITTEHDPYEAGLGFAVRMDKGDFVGRTALEGKSEAGATRRLMPLVVADRRAVVMGKEPVEVDGRPAGYVTSAAYGFTIDAPIAYAWLSSEVAQPGQDVTIRYFGEGPGDGRDRSLFDPEMARLRGLTSAMVQAISWRTPAVNEVHHMVLTLGDAGCAMARIDLHAIWGPRPGWRGAGGGPAATLCSLSPNRT